jgi:Protein of unknown function (DUF4238)
VTDNEPRGHHLLAQLYQRGFANERNQVRVAERSTGRCYQANIEKVFKENDFNAFRDENGELCQDIERLLADHVDTPASRGFNALRGGEFPLPPDQREDVARFIAAQLTRGRHGRAKSSEFLTGLEAHVARLAAQHYTDAHWVARIGRVPTEDERRQLMSGELPEAPSEGPLLEMMLAPIDIATELLLQRTWTLVCFPEPSLFTSEEPVSLHGGGAVGNAEEVMLPVSITQALLLTHHGSGLGENILNAEAALAERFNLRTLAWPLSRNLLLSPDIERHPLPAHVDVPDCAEATLSVLRGE